MVKHTLRYSALALAMTTSSQLMANDKIHISGFASLIGGTVIDGDGYWARLPDAAGQYDRGFEFETESRLGVQARYKAADKLSVTGQLMFRGVNEFEPELEWFYATYSATPDLNVSVGRMRIPVYHYSDFMDVGIAYPWLRVPSDAYSLAVTNYQGISLQYNWDWGVGITTFKAYTGQQDTDPNELITTIEQYKEWQFYEDNGSWQGVADIRTTKKYEDMKGLVIDTVIDWFQLRLSHLEGRENFTFYLPGDWPNTPFFGDTWVDTKFLDISVTADYENIFAMAEWNQYDTIYESWFTSFAYRLGEWQPYVFYSHFEGELDYICPGGASVNGSNAGNLTFITDCPSNSLDDDYSTVGIGIRYNLNPFTALKFEYTDFQDDGDASVYIDRDQDGDTDAKAIFVGLDIAF